MKPRFGPSRSRPASPDLAVARRRRERDGLPKHVRAQSQNATLDDVAARCGVSYQTVSRVVNGSPLVAEKTRVTVLKAIADLNYRPNLAARRLATRRSNLIGMIGSHMTYYGPAQVMVSIEETAKRQGYNLIFSGVENPGETELLAAIDDLCEQQIDGLVIGVRFEGWIAAVRKHCREVPFVTVGNRIDDDIPGVVVDEFQGVRLATRHLLELGHQNIACISGPPDWPATQARYRAWHTTIKKAGRQPGPYVQGNWSTQSGYDAAIRLLRSGQPAFTAIVACNDHMALGALRALHANKIRVPRQISIVGYDDVPESRFFEPPLTTVHHDFVAEGERCVETLLRMINRESVDTTLQVLSPELVVRESTAKVNRRQKLT
ncbi:MAG: LacI family DNA-binding transcriptional regulator [Verrucomicrobia bacterium]|nr:LacI family DNA-binding transcriptional regulator [Verrucomicrobiota bacterium]